MDQQKVIGTNYQRGYANRDLFNCVEGLTQMEKIKKFQTSQKVSKSLGTMKPAQRKSIRGYLQLDCKTLRSNGTIKDIRLKELESLMDDCHIVLIESSEGTTIEFKMVFRETKFNICGGGKTVIQEHVLLNFNISPKKLKTTRAQIAKDQANKKLNQGETEGDDNLLVFEENDALGFDPDQFLKLITQMER
jgi:hypothetical protein